MDTPCKSTLNMICNNLLPIIGILSILKAQRNNIYMEGNRSVTCTFANHVKAQKSFCLLLQLLIGDDFFLLVIHAQISVNMARPGHLLSPFSVCK